MPRMPPVCLSLAGAALLALGGCALPTTAGFDSRIASLVGRPEAEVVATLGVPVRTHEAGGQRFLQYEDRRIVSYPGSYPVGAYPFGGYRSRFYGGFGGFGGFPPSIESRECDLTIAVRNGRMEGFTRRGDDCRALPPNLG
jgi:hypothetical protein